MTFRGAAERLPNAAIGEAAKALSCEPAVLEAVLQIETSGSGYDEEGRPIALFEPHIFYRKLVSNPNRLQSAVEQGLAYKDWREGDYPRDSYPRIIAACRINREAALQSTSWGIGQVLGENHQACGYANCDEMVAAAMDSESAQLEQMVSFIRSKRLDKALQIKKWKEFAEGYNGKEQAKHNYADRLATAYSHILTESDLSVSAQPTGAQLSAADELNALELADIAQGGHG